ncbi:SRPBCC domain-containing protein [Tropicimonas sediminicola]|uniref:Activator of Hsp90 ATPase homolog 1-like protein n=1 Tax=Tropicimonas sediminicola TaxID=1031541 RepID=A0A239FGE7_9RHOB|nr:SRPBCC domain-containing protein [Tropicimonas sediminicola]SNS55608.1 Activator of Hsp90 ATPase homolog 1-like protein [Tropicimonas sediminicola]
MPDTVLIVRKTYSLPVTPDTAFRLFTAEIGGWWPVGSHSLSASEGRLPLEIWMEQRQGGRIRERRHDGSVVDWATLTTWLPHERLELDWYVGRARTDATSIMLDFASDGPDATRLLLTHGGFERLGTAGEAAAANYDEGWDLVLGERFLQACEGD